MNSLNDLHLRQAKKKIFFDQPTRHKLQDKVARESNIRVAQSQIGRSITITQQLKKQLQELQSNNNELKKLLREERERYDRLFEQYDDLTQKNSVIEKQYINLKYEHNKEIKELKKSISNVITEKINKALEEYQFILKEEKVAQSMKTRLDRFVQKIKELSHITEKFKTKKGKNGSEIYQFIEQRPSASNIVQKSLLLQKKIDFFQLQEPPMAKICSSPQKQKQFNGLKSQSDASSRQTIIFEDEYYGGIQDFAQYEQKIAQRRNYELMRRNSRASNQIKRKKIFEQHG